MDLADAQFELVNRLIGPILGLAVILSLSACGGGSSDTSPGATTPPPTAITSVGSITGFGSVWINGVKYEIEAGTIFAIEDVMRMSADGEPVGAGEPSAEALLHSQLYRRDERISAILHTHSVNATLASQTDAKQLNFQGLEILKAFSGINTHDTSIAIPIFDNDQDIESLAEDVERHMSEHDQGVAYLIAGHGVYTWGSGVDECMRHLEALEFLFDYARLSRAGVAG